MQPVHCETCNRTMPLSIAENPELHPCAKEPPMTTSDPKPGEHDALLAKLRQISEGNYSLRVRMLVLAAADALRAEQRARQAQQQRIDAALKELDAFRVHTAQVSVSMRAALTVSSESKEPDHE